MTAITFKQQLISALALATKANMLDQLMYANFAAKYVGMDAPQDDLGKLRVLIRFRAMQIVELAEEIMKVSGEE